MRYEFDQHKSEMNLAKHGIDFVDAQALFDDPEMIATAVHRGGESRWISIGRMFGSCWVCIYTMRGDAIRIISVRRATRKEAAIYDRSYGSPGPR